MVIKTRGTKNFKVGPGQEKILPMRRKTGGLSKGGTKQVEKDWEQDWNEVSNPSSVCSAKRQLLSIQSKVLDRKLADGSPPAGCRPRAVLTHKIGDKKRQLSISDKRVL